MLSVYFTSEIKVTDLLQTKFGLKAVEKKKDLFNNELVVLPSNF